MMFKINRKIEYALMSLKHMMTKGSDELTTAKEISVVYKVPFDATARVLQLMAQNGLLKSEQGVRGGYQIVKDLTAVSFLELAEYILGPVNLVNCLYEDEHQCHLTSTCNIISPVSRLNVKMKEFYKDLSLSDLVASEAVLERTEETPREFIV